MELFISDLISGMSGSYSLVLMQEVAGLLRSGPVCPDSWAAVQKYFQKHAPGLLSPECSPE
jgi:hypothetical protein